MELLHSQIQLLRRLIWKQLPMGVALVQDLVIRYVLVLAQEQVAHKVVIFSVQKPVLVHVNAVVLSLVVMLVLTHALAVAQDRVLALLKDHVAAVAMLVCPHAKEDAKAGALVVAKTLAVVVVALVQVAAKNRAKERVLDVVVSVTDRVLELVQAVAHLAPKGVEVQCFGNIRMKYEASQRILAIWYSKEYYIYCYEGLSVGL